MVSLSEREEFRSTCSVISASTMSVLAGAAGLPPKSTSIKRPPAFGGVSTLTAAPRIGRLQPFTAAADPARRRFREIEIAINAVNHALAAEGREPLVDLPADGAELRIGGVTERQHAEFDAVEARAHPAPPHLGRPP